LIHPIEKQSYQIISDQFDFAGLDHLQQAVAKRIVHATADFDFARSIAFSFQGIESAIEAISSDAPVICDVEMVRAGITKYPTSCYLAETKSTVTGMPTRSYTAMKMAAEAHPKGAIFVVGCAPTALFALTELASRAGFQPALVIGLPVGFVGAAESKAQLIESSLPYVSNTGDKGGSAAACAAFNAILTLATSQDDSEI